LRSIENGNLLSIVQHQSNYIKKLYNEAVDANISSGKIIQGYIVAEQSEINIQESRKGNKKALFVVQIFPS
jgi:hypothetical protein